MRSSVSLQPYFSMNISPWMASSIRWQSLEVDSSSELWNFVLTWQLYSLLVYTFTACTGAETDKTSIFLLLQGSFQQASQFGSLQWICFDYINKCALRPSCSNFRCLLKHCPISSGHLSIATFTLEKVTVVLESLIRNLNNALCISLGTSYQELIWCSKRCKVQCWDCG